VCVVQSGDFPLWRKRVLITQLAAQAWESVCARFDFEAVATRLGMRMTIDGSGDEQICIEGVDSYSFCDADGGEPGCESEEESEEEEARDAEPPEPAVSPREGAEGRLADEQVEATVVEAMVVEATVVETTAAEATAMGETDMQLEGEGTPADPTVPDVSGVPAVSIAAPTDRATTRGAALGSATVRAPTTRRAARASTTRAAAVAAVARGGATRRAAKRTAPAEAAPQPRRKKPKKAANGQSAPSAASTESAKARTVASLLPRAVAPAGHALVPVCPPLETASQRRALVGERLLHGWDDGVRLGWFVGRIVRSGVTPGDLRQVPTANFVVRYAAKQTGGQLDGLVACELSPRTHGVDQWWVLLE
jgi:hypothetical protein